jgi:WhiB family redox-sensing transcriptional regulator
VNDTSTDDTTTLRGAALLAEQLGDRDWQDRAACRDLTPVGFYSDDLDDVSAAKRLCLTCPVRRACLDTAVANREPAGVWGGHLFVDGRIVLQKRRRGRPPRQARPEDSFPLVELPEAYRSLVARSGAEPART